MFLQEILHRFRREIIFQQVIVYAQLHGFLYVGEVVVAAQHEYMPRVALFMQRLDEPQSVHHGHTYIGEQ